MSMGGEEVLATLRRVLANARRLLAIVAAPFSRFLGSRYAFHAVVVALLFVPHLFGSRLSEAPWYFGAPRLHSGDEPHYLVYINSVLEDHDLDLANNYDSVHKGSMEAGLLFRHAKLDHHVVWFVGDRRVYWFQLYEMDESKWRTDAAGNPVPTLRPDADLSLLSKREPPWNAPGLAVLLAPLLYPAKGSPYLESYATLYSALALVIASFLWRMFAESLTKDRRVVNMGLAFAFLGTPAWHYGRSIFAEPYLICLMLGVYLFGLVKKRLVLAGFLMGLAIFIKPVVAILGVPLGVALLLRRQIRPVVAYTAPVLLAVCVVLSFNKVLYGGFFHSATEFARGDYLYGALNVFGYPTRGLLTTAPIVLLAALGWPDLIRRRLDLVTIVAATILLFGGTIANRAWAGGYAYSIRFLVPMMPLFCIGLVRELESDRFVGRERALLVSVGLFSILVNGLAAAQYWRAFNNHPFVYLIPNTDF
jgi:hypothetical protein